MTEEIKETIYEAMVKFQGEVSSVPFDSVNPHFRSKFSSLAAIMKAIQEPMAKNGLFLSHRSTLVNGVLVVYTRLYHKSGEFFESEFPITTNKITPQELGSWITYGRRYNTAALTGVVAAADDDGEVAEASSSKPITEDQVEELQSGLDILGKDRTERFFKAFKIAKLEDIKQQDFTVIRNSIKKALEKEVKNDQA